MSQASQSPAQIRVFQQVAVFSVLQASGGQKMAMVECQEVRDALDRLPHTVNAVSFAPSGSAPDEEVLHTLKKALGEGFDAAVSVLPVSEAVKVVEEGWVVGSLPRSEVVSITLPILIDRAVLARMISSPTLADRIDLVEEVLAAGGKVRGISLPL